MMTANGDPPHPSAPAGFWRRIFAGVCDGFFLLTAAGVLLLEVLAAVSLAEHYGWAHTASIEEQIPVWIALGIAWCMLSVIVLPLAYFIVCEGAFGQTLGKRAFGIVVVSAEGLPIGYGRALARVLALPYSLLPAGLGLLWAALSPGKCAWHDYISGTRVVHIS